MWTIFAGVGLRILSAAINMIKGVFDVKSEDTTHFRYLGLDIQQKQNHIVIKQDEYVKSINFLPRKVFYHADSSLSSEELTGCRAAIGKLNWLATQTRPDISFEVSELTACLKQKGVENISLINKTIRKAKKAASQLVLPSLGYLNDAKFIVYCDASFGTHGNGASHGGYIIFLAGNNKEYAPIAWQSRKIKRIVKSTQAAETLSMVDAMEACVYYRKFLLEVLKMDDISSNLPIICKTDSRALCDSSYSSTQILDKRLRIETAIIREMIEKNSIHQLDWVPTSCQIADGLTKKGVPSSKILDHVGASRNNLPK